MIFSEENIGPLFELLEPCKAVEQHEVWHPEGDVYTHSFQALHHALRETNDTDLILAAWFHDVGKQVHKLGHDKESVKLLENLVSMKTLWLIEQHMRAWDLLLGQMRKRQKVIELLGHPWVPELVALVRWDKMARVAHFKPYKTMEQVIELMNAKAELHFKKERRNGPDPK